MNSAPVTDFWLRYRQLPAHIRQQARKTHRLWRINPQLPGLRFKRINAQRSVYSVRINKDYRAADLLIGDTLHWDFIGNHAEYEKYIENL